jgi:hypothetical protein
MPTKAADPNDPVTINVQIARHVRHRFRVAMLEEGRTFSEGITEAIEMLLAQVGSRKQSNRAASAGRK